MRGLALIFYIYFILFILAALGGIASLFVSPKLGLATIINAGIMFFIVWSLDGAMQCENSPTPLSGLFPK